MSYIKLEKGSTEMPTPLTFTFLHFEKYGTYPLTDDVEFDIMKIQRRHCDINSWM